MRIIEIVNANFLENGKISGSEKMREVNLEETRVDAPTFSPYREIIVPQVAHQTEQTKENEQHVRNNSPSHNLSLPKEIAIENIIEPP